MASEPDRQGVFDEAGAVSDPPIDVDRHDGAESSGVDVDRARVPASSPASHGAGRHAALVLGVVVAIVGAVGVSRLGRRLGPRPTAEDCQRLVDRHLEQSEQQKHPGIRTEELARAVAEAKLEPSFALDVETCKQRLTPAEVACGLRATWVDELERCLQ